MKAKFTSLLLLLAGQLCASAQQISPDPAKIIGTIAPNIGKPVQCAGLVNNPGVDLQWKPILSSKFKESEPLEPNAELIEQIKEEKRVLRQSYENKSGEKATSVAPVIGSNFAGNLCDGYSPLDNSVAIANNGNIVSVSNSTIGYFNTSGTNLYYNEITSFLPASFGVASVCDPVVIYDAHADKFIFFCQVAPLTAFGSIYVSFSKTNNPMDGWYCYALACDPAGNGDAFDYPKLAVDDNNLFITGNMFSEPAGTFHQAMVFQIDKSAGYAGASLTYDYWQGITGSPFTLLPLSNGQGASSGPGIYLVSTQNGGGSTINLYQITADICCTPAMNNWSVATTAYTAPGDANQSGTSCTLKTGDCRALSGFVLNNMIHFVFNSDIGGGYTGINYNRLSIASLTNISSGFGSSGYDYAYPSVASYATSATDKSVMIGFGRTGSSIYPEIRVVNCDNNMSWSNSTLVKPSDNYVSYTSASAERWGDYTGMSRNHGNPTASVWMSGMFGDASNKWDSWIAEVHGIPNAVANVNEQKTAKVFPNPISKAFTVEFALTENSPVDISVVDMAGRVVKQLYSGNGTTGDNVFSFDKSNLANGIYTLVIKSNTSIIKNEKIVIAD